MRLLSFGLSAWNPAAVNGAAAALNGEVSSASNGEAPAALPDLGRRRACRIHYSSLRSDSMIDSNFARWLR